MAENLIAGRWARPESVGFEGRHVTVARLDPEADGTELWEVSHRPEEYQRLWTYMPYGPFPDPAAMLHWLESIRDSADPLFYTVTSRALGRKVGMFSLLNIVPEMGRAELGHIWYSPLAQRSAVNTEVAFLFLRHLFDDLGYRRAEWKCDNDNEPSKRAALRLGFQYEGLFRKHMIVKGRNRDTAWFAMTDDDWPAVRASFEAYFARPGVSLTALNCGRRSEP